MSIFQPDLFQRLAAVVGTVDAIAERDVAANAGFAGADINDVRIGFRDRDAADGGSGLLLEKRIPGNAAVGGFPNTAGNPAKIVSVRLTRHAGDGKRAASAKRAHKAP